jgi:hypothetical protein
MDLPPTPQVSGEVKHGNFLAKQGINGSLLD